MTLLLISLKNGSDKVWHINFGEMKLRRGLTHLLVPVVVSFIVALGVVYYFSSNTTSAGPISGKLEKIVVGPSESPIPTPFPFQELTIPYLRDREYKSELGPRTKYSENASYTAYLTSYNSDGLKVNGLLTVPKGQGPFPAVVFVHGYIAPTIYKTTEKYNDYVDYLARNGLVVFKIDLRGHGNSEGDPGGGYYSGDYVIDTLNARAALSGADFVDPERIGLWGHSMAGNVVFRALVAKNVTAAVIWAGAVYTYEDMSEFRISDNSYRPPAEDSPVRKKREELNSTYGSFDPESSFWQQVVPTNYLEGVSGAIQVHHAVDDTVVDVGYSRNLMSILDNSQIGHELYEYTSGGHNITGSRFTLAMQRTVEFFKSNL